MQVTLITSTQRQGIPPTTCSLTLPARGACGAYVSICCKTSGSLVDDMDSDSPIVSSRQRQVLGNAEETRKYSDELFFMIEWQIERLKPRIPFTSPGRVVASTSSSHASLTAHDSCKRRLGWFCVTSFGVDNWLGRIEAFRTIRVWNDQDSSGMIAARAVIVIRSCIRCKTRFQDRLQGPQKPWAHIVSLLSDRSCPRLFRRESTLRCPYQS